MSVGMKKNNFDTLQEAAVAISKAVKDQIKHYKGWESSGWRDADTITFTPTYDIICSEGNDKFSPRYCLALNEQERMEFWYHLRIL